MPPKLKFETVKQFFTDNCIRKWIKQYQKNL